MISTKQFCALSNGSACTSKSYAPSYVLKAMGIPENMIESIIRMSWGSHVAEDELYANFNDLIMFAKRFQE